MDSLHSPNYATHWARAVQRTKSFDLSVPPHTLEPERRYFNPLRMAEFPYVVQRGLGDLQLQHVAAQCLAINHRLVPVMQQWFGCPVLYTLGWIDDGTRKGMFKFDDAFIGDMLKNGHRSLTVNIHAWLTLPSMEIIDFTIVTTMATEQRRTKGIGSVLARHPDELRGFAYRPMLIGTDFLRRSGLMVEVEIDEL